MSVYLVSFPYRGKTIFKIGVSKNVPDRMRQLRNQYQATMLIHQIDTMDEIEEYFLEEHLHGIFKRKRCRDHYSRELFIFTEKDVRAYKNYVDQWIANKNRQEGRTFLGWLRR